MTWTEIICWILAGLGALAVDVILGGLFSAWLVKGRIKKWMQDE